MNNSQSYRIVYYVSDGSKDFHVEVKANFSELRKFEHPDDISDMSIPMFYTSLVDAEAQYKIWLDRIGRHNDPKLGVQFLKAGKIKNLWLTEDDVNYGQHLIDMLKEI